MKKIIFYNIDVCPAAGIPVRFRITKKEFLRFINTYNIKSTFKIINFGNVTEYRYKYEKNDIKILAIKTILL